MNREFHYHSKLVYWLSIFSLYITGFFLQPYIETSSLQNLIIKLWWQGFIETKEWNFYYFHNPDFLKTPFSFPLFPALDCIRAYLSYHIIIKIIFFITLVLHFLIVFKKRINKTTGLFLSICSIFLLSMFPLFSAPFVIYLPFLIYFQIKKGRYFYFLVHLIFFILYLPLIFLFIPFEWMQDSPKREGSLSNRVLLLGVVLSGTISQFFIQKNYLISLKTHLFAGHYSRIFQSTPLWKTIMHSGSALSLELCIACCFAILLLVYMLRQRLNKKIRILLIIAIISFFILFFAFLPQEPSLLILLFTLIGLFISILSKKINSVRFRYLSFLYGILLLCILVYTAFFTDFSPRSTDSRAFKTNSKTLIVNISPFTDKTHEIFYNLNQLMLKKDIKTIVFTDLSIVPSLRDLYLKNYTQKNTAHKRRIQMHQRFYNIEREYFKNIMHKYDLFTKNATDRESSSKKLTILISRKKAKELTKGRSNFPTRLEQLFYHKENLEFILY